MQKIGVLTKDTENGVYVTRVIHLNTKRSYNHIIPNIQSILERSNFNTGDMQCISAITNTVRKVLPHPTNVDFISIQFMTDMVGDQIEEYG